MVRALFAFWDLYQARDIPLQRIVYVPAALAAGIAMSGLRLWRLGRRLFGQDGRDGRTSSSRHGPPGENRGEK